MNSMSLQKKLYILVATLLTFCVLVGIVGFQSSQKIAKDYGEIEEINLPNMTAVLQGVAHIRGARIYLLQLVLPNQSQEENKDMRGRIEAEWKGYDEQDKKYNEIPFSEGEEAVYSKVKDAVNVLRKDFSKVLELQAKSEGKEGPSMSEARRIVDDDIMAHGLEFRKTSEALLDFHKMRVKEAADAAHDARNSGTKWIIAGICGAILLGGFLSFLVLKNIMAEQAAASQAAIAATRSASMVDNSPISTMMCDPEGKLIYMNESTIINLRKLQQYIPDKVENLMGKSIDIFHKNPAVQRKIISDPKNLPHRAVIALGPEKLDLLVTSSIDPSGKYLGAALSWSIVTEKVELVRDLTKASEDLANAASNVLTVSSSLSAAAEETSAQANTASVASEEVNAGVQTVASNMEEMTAAIKEITKTTNEAASMTNEAMRMAKNTNQIINQLGDSSMDIGNVIKVISSIAQQTNLLALNATIEAARAGEAGKGFAVVANEVKELANQTAKATNEITKKIETIQGDSKNAIDAIAEISGAIEKVNGFTGNIAASVEEQAATTSDITRIITESAEGVKQINENIGQVSQAAANTGRDAGSAQSAARNVGETAELLKKYVARLKV